MIPLYGHNQQAYDASVSLMDEIGKAAVIQTCGATF